MWRGYRFGDDLAAHFASADCFVFPSRTETFGNVLLEAMASGVPVASVPAPGPVDLVQEGVNGAIDDDLLRRLPARAALLAREGAREHRARTLQAGHEVFRAHLVPVQPHRLPVPSRTGSAPKWRPRAESAPAVPAALT